MAIQKWTFNYQTSHFGHQCTNTTYCQHRKMLINYPLLLLAQQNQKNPVPSNILKSLKSAIFQNMTLAVSQKSRHFEGANCLHLHVQRISQTTSNTLVLLTYILLVLLTLTLKMKAVYSSATSVDFLKTTQHHIPDDVIIITTSDSTQ